MVLCKACGFSNLDQDRFCGRCGHTMMAPVPEPVTVESNRARQADLPVNDGLSLDLSDNPAPPSFSYLLEEDEPRSGKGVLLLTLVVLLFLGAAGYVAYQKYYLTLPLSTTVPTASVPAFAYDRTPPTAIADLSIASTEPVLPSRNLRDTLALENISAAMRESAAKDRLAESNAPEAVGARLLAEGEKYLYGRGVPSNCQYAVKSFQGAADKGNARAMAHLGSLYGSGRCVKFSRVQAYQWFAKAKEANPDNTWYESSMDMLWRNMSREERAAILK